MNTQTMLGIGAGVAVIIVIVAGSAAYMAQDSERDDMLYNVGTSPDGDTPADADIESHMKGADDAYEAAVMMEANGTLNATERARLTAEYSAHVNAVAGRIAELEAQGNTSAALEIRTKLRETLRNYRDVFPTIGVDVDNSMDIDADASAGSSDAESSSSVTSA